MGQARARQSTGEAKPVQESEGKGHRPGMENGEARFAAPRADNFRSAEQDA